MRGMQKNETVEITRLSHEGRGIAHVQGKTTFVQGALPGEIVTLEYTEKRGRFNSAKVISYENPSPDRIAPICPHFGICGGCSLQHINPEKQIALKENLLFEQLEHIAQATPKIKLPALKGPTQHYRRSARLGVRYVIKKERVLVGFHEMSGRYLADLTQCPILDARLSHRLLDLATVVRSLSIFMHIAQIEVACGDDSCALIFRHLKPLIPDDEQQLKAFGKQFQFHIYLQPAGPDSIHRLFPETGDPYLHYSLKKYDLTFAFHPSDFIQINADINAQMIDQALQLLNIKSHETVLDLFSGLGNFSLPLAQRAKQVYAYEGSAAVVSRAKENAERNNIRNVQFETANLFSTTQAFTTLPFDKVLLDPPRAGAAEIIPLLTKAKEILYVSCHPATLARDTAILLQHGYTVQAAGILDMFPHTTHVESMAHFIYNH